jgi:cyclohexanone monooxygenase
MNQPVTHFDAVVVGAGFGGLSMLHELRKMDLTVKVLESASDVGGTWYWNRYPGARTDSESWYYSTYSFAKEIKDEWNWSERYPAQPEVLRYLRFVTDRLDLRKDIQFNTHVENATYDESSGQWFITTRDGGSYTARYFILAVGIVSHPYIPPFPGLEKFSGEHYVTSRWPHEPVDLAGKRVLVVGTGATAVQLLPIIAHAAEHVTVFQRTPNYVLPARNYSLTGEQQHAIRRDHDEIFDKARNHFFGMPFTTAEYGADEVPSEDWHRVLDGGWEIGGFRYLFETFNDILFNDKANDLAAEFIRNKIRAIVKDPKTAELLCPKNYPLGGKRPPLGHLYYETFNRDNVDLVDVSETPIDEITANGLRIGDTEYEADVLIFATGFDAVTGAARHIDIRGRNGITIKEKWEDGPRSYLGMTVDQFPNMFMVCGPQTPFANIPLVIEICVEWIRDTIAHLQAEGIGAIEATPAASEKWRDYMDELVHQTVVHKGRHAWFMGDNIPGKKRVVLVHFGGIDVFQRECDEVRESGFEGFALSGSNTQS